MSSMMPTQYVVFTYPLQISAPPFCFVEDPMFPLSELTPWWKKQTRNEKVIERSQRLMEGQDMCPWGTWSWEGDY
jgi:hypothetical protein